MKIALLDLNHITRGVHTNTVPLGLGLIYRYLVKTVVHQFDVRIFKDPQRALNILDSWVPDVVGISQYSWNSELNLYFSALIKQANPNCLVVAGGPNLNLSASGRKKFFEEHPRVDICIFYDGEIPFAEIIKRLLKGERITDLRKTPVAGTYMYEKDKKQIVDSLQAPPRVNSLDVFGSLYADGIFNELLEDGFHPFLQTHRGCPFECAFCHTSDAYYSRMLFLSPEIFKRDMEYLGRRFQGKHDVILYLANTNMSLFKQDFTIAEIIRDIQKRFNWPRFISVNSGKDTQKLLKMLSIIKFQPAIALQTLTAHVLNNIRRKNIPLTDFVNFQHEVLRKTGETSSTELILCLPGETKDTFLETLKVVLNSGVQNIVIYTLMNLKGTPLSSEEYSSRYKYLVRHRVVPRQFSIVKGKKILDTEEVIVGTDTMSFDDYLQLRCLAFTITVFFSSTELIPLKRLLLEYNIDVSDWIFGIHARLCEFPEFESLYDEFIRETEEELFSSREALLDFFENEENFQALRSGLLGDNLLRKYKCKALSYNYKSLVKLAVSEAHKLLSRRLEEKIADSLLKDMNVYLLSREVKEIFDNPKFIFKRNFHLNYDIPRWLLTSKEHSLLEDFCGSYDYTVSFDEDIIKKAQDFISMNRDRDLSLQILYRDGNIRDFWPGWILSNENVYQKQNI